MDKPASDVESHRRMAASSEPQGEKPNTSVSAVSSGFKLPLPSPELSQGEAEDAADNEKNRQPSVFSSGLPMEDEDSGMFSFNASRPSTRAGAGAYASSFFAGSRTNTGIGISHISPSSAREGHRRPLTALTIREEADTEMEHLSPAAAMAAAYRLGRNRLAIGDRASRMNTPIIELDEQLRDAARREEDMSEGSSTPAGSGRTDFE